MGLCVFVLSEFISWQNVTRDKQIPGTLLRPPLHFSSSSCLLIFISTCKVFVTQLIGHLRQSTLEMDCAYFTCI